jgi:hypothetical protein
VSRAEKNGQFLHLTVFFSEIRASYLRTKRSCFPGGASAANLPDNLQELLAAFVDEPDPEEAVEPAGEPDPEEELDPEVPD